VLLGLLKTDYVKLFLNDP